MALKRIGILAHPQRPDAGRVCSQVGQSLKARGIDVWEQTTWDPSTIRSEVDGSDIVIAIGGDGAMLRAARVCAWANVPVFGINAGHLGFLTETSPDNWPSALDMMLAGDYWIEERMMIRSEAYRGDRLLIQDHALNDVVISRGDIPRSIIVETYIDHDWTTTYNADGLVIATPTGSTAYALAVGGPILPPELKNILVVPVAAHLSFDRPLVLAEGVTVENIIAPETPGDVALDVDGERVTELQKGDAVVVQASHLLSRFVRLRDRNYFYRSILDRMEPRMPARREPIARTRALPGSNNKNGENV